jgi:hypothetical protein
MQMGQRAAEVAISYGWDKIARQILAVYQELTRARAAATGG